MDHHCLLAGIQSKSTLLLFLIPLSAKQIYITEVIGEKTEDILTKAPVNGASIGSLKTLTQSEWFASRPSGTKDVYKIYGENFLDEILKRAQEIVTHVLSTAQSKNEDSP